MKKGIVLGNGRSLKDFDFDKIDCEWIGCCLAFRYWDKINKYPDYYVNVDTVVCQNAEVIEFVKKEKCKMYLLSKSISQAEPNDLPKDKIVFIEDILIDPRSIFKYTRNWCSGSSSVMLALELFEDIHIAGFDCDYVEFIPECDKQPDGTLKIKKTPKYNPNYFFDDYQREGDIYNVPNGKTVHYQSWKEVSEILRHLSVMYPECERNVTNYNNKKSISEYFKTKSQDKFMCHNLTHNKTRVAFCVPTTSNKRNWSKLEESYLYSIMLPSIKTLTNDFDIEVYVGYDTDDTLYSNISLPDKYDDIKLKWFQFDDCKGNPCEIWSELTGKAIDNGIEYIQIGGDDIKYDSRKEWLGKFIKLLKQNNNVGYSAGFSNNVVIPTQFLIHKKHYQHFGWVFPPQIHNWFCDNFLYGLYSNHGNWIKEYNHSNLGGEPRYKPNNDKELCRMLIKRHKKTLASLI